MTKEEALTLILKNYKDCKNKNTMELSNLCKGIKCDECPFYSVSACVFNISIGLIERLIKVEENKETNLEHYWRTSYEVDGGESYLISVESSKKAYDAFHLGDMKEWLLSPYEKPKHKLTKFEYDLLKCYCEPLLKITDIWILVQMKSTGYYKDIPHNVSIKDIIDNCEVTEQ